MASIDKQLRMLKNNTDATAPISGFNPSVPLTMPLVELSKDGVEVRKYAGDRSYSETADGLFSDGTIALSRQLRLMPQVGGQVSAFCGGEKIDISAQTVTFPNSSGVHYVWLSVNGILTTSQVKPVGIFGILSVVAIVYGNAEDQKVVVFSVETHTTLVNSEFHKWAHYSLHTLWKSGLELSGVVGGGLTHGAITAGVLIDEEIDISTIDQPLAQHLYRVGEFWKVTEATDSIAHMVGDVAQFNPNTSYTNYENANGSPNSGIYALRDIPGQDDVMVVYFLGTSDGGRWTKKVLGQEVYKNIGEALEQAEYAVHRLTTDGLASPENALMYISLVKKDGSVMLFADSSPWLDYRKINVRM